MAKLPPLIPPPIRVSRDPAAIALIVLMWLGWLCVMVVADLLGFLMFAFADSPGSTDAAKLMILPTFIWFGVTFVAGIALLYFRRWWTIALAFLLAISPPFLVLAGYNILSAAGKPSASRMPSAPPAVRVQPGGFAPAPTTQSERPGRFAPPQTSQPVQPDFQKAIREARRAATTAGG